MPYSVTGDVELTVLRDENASLHAEVAGLRAENATLRATVVRLQGEVSQVQAQVAERAHRPPPPAFVKANTPLLPKKPRKKRASE